VRAQSANARRYRGRCHAAVRAAVPDRTRDHAHQKLRENNGNKPAQCAKIVRGGNAVRCERGGAVRRLFYAGRIRSLPCEGVAAHAATAGHA